MPDYAKCQVGTALKTLASSLLLISILCTSQAFASDSTKLTPTWLGTWATATQVAAESDLPSVGFADVTLRQVIHVSAGGRRLRLRLSNVFGKAPLELTHARIALSAGGGSIVVSREKKLTFDGVDGVHIAPGAIVTTDPIDFDLAPLSNIAITLHIKNAPSEITSHPGSRTTSYFVAGNDVSSPELPQAIKIDRWYFIAGLDVQTADAPGVIAIVGDSLTDGRGSTTNGNDRWPDAFSKRLRANEETHDIGVLNMGIGGNRLLRDGLGPSALSRVERDIFDQPAVRWLIVLEGVNDIGTRLRAKEKGESWATVDDLIAGYEQIISLAHARGIKVYGATILPFGGSTYAAPDTIADRLKINSWILNRAKFDGVVDFAKTTCDPERPDYLLPAYDSGDHLHLTPAGYAAMADAIPLSFFTSEPSVAGRPPKMAFTVADPASLSIQQSFNNYRTFYLH
jgi:lysophospholipase L1-like esterase